jgi:hypothetical protein
MMTKTDIEKRVARIREQGHCSDFERDWLCDTVDALRARVADLERERDIALEEAKMWKIAADFHQSA